MSVAATEKLSPQNGVEMSMTCKQAQQSFDERLDERLTESQRAVFDEHVAACAECRREWQAYADAWGVLERHAGIEPSVGFVQRTLQRLDEPRPVARPWFWRPVFRWGALVTAAIALSVGAWVRHQRTVEQRRVEIYASVRQAEYLEDFDVVANLDQLKGNDKL